MTVEKGVALFHTTHDALRAEKALKGAGMTVKLIPVPRFLSSSCGISLRFQWDEREIARQLLEGAGVEVQGFHPLHHHP